jgi:hypothetical protein
LPNEDAIDLFAVDLERDVLTASEPIVTHPDQYGRLGGQQIAMRS